MMSFVIFIFAHVLLQAAACPDTTTTVHIQNHDGPIYLSPERLPSDNQLTIGNHEIYGNRAACSNRPYTGDLSPQLLHNNYPCHACATDCKCVTNQLSTYVPINTVPQNTYTPGTYSCPDYYSYGYGYYPEAHGSDGCPISSEGLIPLLKSYIGQSKCPKHGCQCGQSYSSN